MQGVAETGRELAESERKIRATTNHPTVGTGDVAEMTRDRP
jgi:hypothetical protein